MSPTAVKDSLQFQESTSRPKSDLHTCNRNACKAPKQHKDGVNRQTDMGPSKPQKEHLSPIEDVMLGGKYAQSPWDASSDLVIGRPSLYLPHHR